MENRGYSICEVGNLIGDGQKTTNRSLSYVLYIRRNLSYNRDIEYNRRKHEETNKTRSFYDHTQFNTNAKRDYYYFYKRDFKS